MELGVGGRGFWGDWTGLGWGASIKSNACVFSVSELWFLCCSPFREAVLLYSKPYFERMQGVWFLRFTDVL